MKKINKAAKAMGMPNRDLNKKGFRNWQFHVPLIPIDSFKAPECGKCNLLTLAMAYEKEVQNGRVYWFPNWLRFKCVQCETYFWREYLENGQTYTSSFRARYRMDAFRKSIQENQRTGNGRGVIPKRSRGKANNHRVFG